MSDAGLEGGREITRRPAVVAGAIAAAAAIAAVGATALVSTLGALLGGVGLAALAVGLVRGAEEMVDVGCLGIFFGVVVGGLESGAVEATLVGTVCAVVAWDLAGSAIDLGDQLGREASTARLEAVHAISSVLVGLGTVGVAYGIYALAAGGQPIAALALSVVAALLVTVGLGTSRGRNDVRGRSRRP